MSQTCWKLGGIFMTGHCWVQCYNISGGFVSFFNIHGVHFIYSIKSWKIIFNTKLNLNRISCTICRGHGVSHEHKQNSKVSWGCNWGLLAPIHFEWITVRDGLFLYTAGPASFYDKIFHVASCLYTPMKTKTVTIKQQSGNPLVCRAWTIPLFLSWHFS